MERSIQWAVLKAFFALSAVFLVITPVLADEEPRWQISRNYTDIKLFLRDVAAKYPKTSRVIQIGESDTPLNRTTREKIYGLMIIPPGSRASTPRSLVVGTHHGNEYGSTEVAKAVAQDLAASPIPGLVTFVIPVLNISGYNIRSRYEILGKERVDSNRDYLGPCGTSGPFLLRSTKALASFIERAKISSSATLHTYQGGVYYPWGLSTRETDTAYTEGFRKLGALATQWSHYDVGNSTELLYPADGTYEDYAFWKHGIWSLLFELGHSHNPSQLQVEEMIATNVPGIRNFLAHAPRQLAARHAFEGKCEKVRRGFEKQE